MEGFESEAVEDGKRYRIKIDGNSYYVWLSDISVSVAYAYENREDNIKTRTILEKFCAELSRVMKERHDNIRQAVLATHGIGERTGDESKAGSPPEVCG